MKIREVPGALLGLGWRRYRWLPAGVLACLVLALVFLPRLRVELDVLSLLPDTNEKISAFRGALEDFGSMDVVLVALDIERSGLEEGREYGRQLAEALRASGLVSWVQFELEDFTSALGDLAPYALLFASDEELDRMETTLSPDGLDAAARVLGDRLRLPLGGTQTELLRRDPLGLLEGVVDRVSSSAPTGLLSGSSGVALSDDGRYLLMIARPIRPAADIVFGERLINEIARIESAIDATWEEEWGGAAPDVLVAGGPALAAWDSRQIQRDVMVGSVAALVSVALLFAIAFRRAVALLFALLPLLLGLILVALAALVMLGQLNAATSVFAAMLIGLGIDYVILLYGRFMDERSAGRGPDESLAVIQRQTVLSAAIAALTTSAAMFCLTLSEFRGLADLGLLAGVGILLLLLSVCVVLPGLLAWFEQRSERPAAGADGPATEPRTVEKKRLRGFGFGHLGEWSLARPRRAGLVAVLATAGLALTATAASYNESVIELRSQDNPAILAQEQLMEAFDTRFTPFLVRVDGEDEGETLERAIRVDAELQRLVQEGELVRRESISSLLPSAARQQEVLERIAEWPALVDGFADRFTASLMRNGLNPKAFEQGIAETAAALHQSRPLRLADHVDGRMAPLLGRYFRAFEEADEPRKTSLLAFAYMDPDGPRSFVPPGLPALGDLPGATVTGPVVVSKEIRRLVVEDAGWVALVAFLCVGTTLSITLGGLVPAAVALLPMVMGTLWLIGWLGLFGVELNLFNLFVFPMLIGISVDYGVHMVHCLREGGTAAEVGATARAIGVAALTTVLGFGSLSLSHFPGLRSMGIVAVLGALSSALCAVLVLPALARWIRRRERAG